MSHGRGGSDKMSRATGWDDDSPTVSFPTALMAITARNCLLWRVMRPFAPTARTHPHHAAHSLRWDG
jgi:hypothetical protein